MDRGPHGLGRRRRAGRLLRPPGEGPADGRHRPAVRALLGPQAVRSVTLSGLVLNEKGLDRGLACGVEMFCMGVSASETHSRKNTGMSIEDANARIVAMAKSALAAGKRVQVSVQSAFGCGYEGPVPKERVVAIVKTFLDAGLRGLSLADTAGHATPDDVARPLQRASALSTRRPSGRATSTTPTASPSRTATRRGRPASRTSSRRSRASAAARSRRSPAGTPAPRISSTRGSGTASARTSASTRSSTWRAGSPAFFQRDMPGSVYRSGPIPEPAAAGAAR